MPHPVIIQMLKIHKTILRHQLHALTSEDHSDDLANTVKSVEVVMEQMKSYALRMAVTAY